MRELIYLDVETTGLNPEEDVIVELTWARREGEPKTLYFGVEEVPEFIDNLIGFTKRGIAGKMSNFYEVHEFLTAADGATMVAANPAFDKSFLEAAGLWQFHYRMLDIQTFAMAKFNLTEVPSMKNIYDALSGAGIPLTEPDHTSRNDVLAMREAHKYLETVNG